VKAPSAGFRIIRDRPDRPFASLWVIYDDGDPNDPKATPKERPVWTGKTFKGARTAHYRLAVARLTGKPVSYEQARRAGNC
jgi:hypothetical protein